MKQASLKSLLKKATMDRYDSEEDIDMNHMSTSDLLASLGMSNSKSMRSSRSNLGLMGSPTMMAHTMSKSQLKEPEVTGIMDLQDLSMAEIHQKFSEVYDENNLLRVSLQAEVNIREKLERKNREVSEKLTEARQGLQETRTALINLQAVTEDLIQRKEERELQLQKVVGISKTYERRIAELETNSVKSEEVAKLHSIISSTKLSVMEKEEAMQQLEQQIIQLQQAVRSARNDVQVAIEEKKFVEVKLQHAGEKINQLELAVEKQKEKTADFQKVNMNLEAAISSLRDKMADMQMVKVNLETVKMGLESSNSKHKERISELTTANQELQNKITALTRAKLELEHKIHDFQSDLESKRLTEVAVTNAATMVANQRQNELENKLVDMTKERSGLEERMMALEKMLTSLPMLAGASSSSSNNNNSHSTNNNQSNSNNNHYVNYNRNISNNQSNNNSHNNNNSSNVGNANSNNRPSPMYRSPSQQRMQQQPPHQQQPQSSPRNVPNTPTNGTPRRQPSLRKSMGQNMLNSNSTEDIIYDENTPDGRSRLTSEASNMSRSGSQQDFVPLNLPLGARTKTQSMDDGSWLRGKLDSWDDPRSKASSMDEPYASRAANTNNNYNNGNNNNNNNFNNKNTNISNNNTNGDVVDADMRQAVERTARAMMQSVMQPPPSGNSPSSILRKTMGSSTPANNASNNDNNNSNISNTPTGTSRVSFSLDNNSVHVIPNKDKENRSKEREREREQREREKERERELREKEKEREREEREREKERERLLREKEQEREREEREKERLLREKERKDREEKERKDKEREERDRRDREEKERLQKEEQKRQQQLQQQIQPAQTQRGSEQRGDQRIEPQRSNSRSDQRPSEGRSQKPISKSVSSKNLDPAAEAATIQVKSMKTEINNMISEHRDLKNKIKEFTDKFKADHNGAEPSKDDRKNLAGDIFKNYEKLSKTIKKKMKELEEFQAANGGIGVSTKLLGPGTPSTKLQTFDKSTKSPRSDADDGSVSTEDSNDS